MPSTYCLLSNGDLHFLPYHSDSEISLADDGGLDIHSAVSTPPPATGGDSFQLYSNLLGGKLPPNISATPSSMISHASSSSLGQSDSSVSSDEERRSSAPRVRQVVEKYCAHAIYLPDRYIEPSGTAKQQSQIRDMLTTIFPRWRQAPERIQSTELTGGITNMLLECSMGNEKVLVRAYGRGTGLIIDRDREFVSHLVLNSYNLAPPIHARFGNGLVYGYISGRSLKVDEMSNPHLYPFIAARLGDWHRMVGVDVIEDSLKKLHRRFNASKGSPSKPNDVWSLLQNWVEVLPEIPGMTAVCAQSRDLQEAKHNATLREILLAELEWLQAEVGAKSPLVAAHSDLLSGNIIMPPDVAVSIDDPQEISKCIQRYQESGTNPLSFIDYEYMMPGPRAFDISNHFQEWQGFNCDKSLVPSPSKSNQLLRRWCAAYLQSDPSSTAVDQLIDEIALYYGMPGLYWGIWAGIQSTISLIDFDYSGYSGQRLVEYWNWKRCYLGK